jgi:hypothetical protein
MSESQAACTKCLGALVAVKRRRFERDVPVILFTIAVVLFLAAVFAAPLSSSTSELFGDLEGLLVGGTVAAWLTKRTRVTCPRCDVVPSPAVEQSVRARVTRNVRLAVTVIGISLVGVGARAWYVRRGPSLEEVTRSIDNGTVASTLGFDRMNPYELVRNAHAAGPHAAQNFATSTAASIRRDNPGSVLTFSESADIENLGQAIRAVVGYRGKLGNKQELFPVVAEVRKYFFVDSQATVDATCFTKLSACSEMQDLLQQAETKLLQAPTASGVGSILPPQGRCSIESEPNGPDSSHDVATCWYQPGTSLSFSRLNLAEWKQSLRATTQDPEIKQLMKQRAQSAQ